MLRSRIYSVGFTVALCAVCAGILTFANTRWEDQIRRNEAFARARAILDSLNLLPPRATRADAMAAFRAAVKSRKRGDVDVYEARRDGRLTGYAVELLGRGRYGPIKGVLSVTPDRERIMAVRVYDHNETPGLGGRIASKEWLRQFAGRPLVTRGTSGFTVDPGAAGPGMIHGITGASRTTFAFSRMLNTAIARFLAGGIRLLELKLGLGPDAVTRATPGYPKTGPKPPHLRKEIRRPPFMVIPGLSNIALRRPVTCSMEDEPIIGEIGQVTDGVKKSGEFDYVELGLGLQWVQIDLGGRHTIHAVVLWHYYKNPIIYSDVIVQVADDAEFTQNVGTLFNNDHDGTAGLGPGKDTAFYSRWWGEIVDARGGENGGVPARFVRVYTGGGHADEETRFVEIAVYGKKCDD